MSYKIKSYLYLSCFVLAFTVYNFSIDKSDNKYSDPAEIAIAELDKVSTSQNLQIEDLK